jgi:tetratricopeptide (TPR) repeat protein
VDTERFNFLLNNPSGATEDDVLLLQDAVKDYPYAQALHIIMAKICFMLNNTAKNKRLSTAAIYASNRAILKEVIQSDTYLGSIKDIVAHQVLPIVELEQKTSNSTFFENIENAASDSASIFDEVLKNLQKLKSLREQFLFLESEDSAEVADANKVGEAAPEHLVEETAPSEKPKKTKRKADKKKKKEAPDGKKEKLEKLQKKELELDSKVNAYLISEISEKRTAQADERKDKVATQEHIIEKFIQEQPSIGNIKKELEKSQEEITKDLSEKSTKFGDDLISENLAIILLKQGKKERAIDIYRKLIWKLPQKKAYFAARIEEIKK